VPRTCSACAAAKRRSVPGELSARGGSPDSAGPPRMTRELSFAGELGRRANQRQRGSVSSPGRDEAADADAELELLKTLLDVTQRMLAEAEPFGQRLASGADLIDRDFAPPPAGAGREGATAMVEAALVAMVAVRPRVMMFWIALHHLLPV
jgi:hypothetical protein